MNMYEKMWTYTMLEIAHRDVGTDAGQGGAFTDLQE